MRRDLLVAALAAVIVLGAWAGYAQELSGPPANPNLKYSTPMPPGVAAPDQVETPFGTLKLFDGVPDQASTEKIYDNLDCQRAFIGSYKFEWQPGVANLDAAAMFFFTAIGVTPAMDTQIVGEGATYPWTAVDADNRSFDGARNYKLHLPPHIPVKTFWSVIVYDTQTRSML
jgi:hypothetical protein